MIQDAAKPVAEALAPSAGRMGAGGSASGPDMSPAGPEAAGRPENELEEEDEDVVAFEKSARALRERFSFLLSVNGAQHAA